MTSVPVNLQEFNAASFKAFLDSFDHVFSDCDGVLWTKNALPGVGKFFDLMKKHGKTVHFVSNNSLRTRENYTNLFNSAGVENGYDKLTVPSIAIAEYLKSVNFNKKVYSISSPETNRILRSYGIEYKEGPDVGVDYYEDYIQYTNPDPEIGAVVMDSDFKVSLPKIHKAVTYLGRPDVLFLCGATERYHYCRPDLRIVAPGIFIQLVAEESGRQPIAMGKPGKLFGEFAMKRAGITDPSRVLFIGDMILQDVALGRAVGFTTLLLLTHTTVDLMLANETTRPHYYAQSLNSLVPLLEKSFN